MAEMKLFENKQIRSIWHEASEEWFFSVADIVEALTGSVDVKQYIKRMRMRDEALNANWGTICTPVAMQAKDGKTRRILAANLQGIFRIIQAIPSPKAEPLKLWLAEVGKERIDEVIDPELTIDRALQTYLQKGYSKEWINQRLQAIQVRKELTDAWDEHGVQGGIEYAILTNEITQAWSGMKTKEYKAFKGLKKENLRDNMSTLELVLNMLAEATTTELTNKKNPQGLAENKKLAREGGEVAGMARKNIESRTGEPVITNKKAVDFAQIITGLFDDKKDLK